MTQDEIRKLLGGYATNALSADERRILFEAALEDQELFNALQNEDALRELLDDPVLRDQVRRALVAPPPRKAGFSWRRWVLGVAMPAVVAVIVILVMDRPKKPEAIPQPVQTARLEPNPIASPPQAPPPAPTAKKQSGSVRRAAPASAPVIAAPAPLEPAPQSVAQLATNFRAADARPLIPDAVRQQFSSGIAASAPLYQGPLLRYSLVRGTLDGNAVRVEVSTAIAGYLALYRVDAAGNLEHIYPANDVAAQVLPNVGMQIPIAPVKVDTGEKLRLVLVPAAPPAVVGALGGAVNGAAQPTMAKPLQAPSTPLVVDIPIGPN